MLAVRRNCCEACSFGGGEGGRVTQGTFLSTGQDLSLGGCHLFVLKYWLHGSPGGGGGGGTPKKIG